jgi:hypothetical protein
MKQAASLKDYRAEMLLNGMKTTTGPNDFFPIEQMQLMQLDGERWNLMGDLIDGEVGSGKPD